MRHQLFQRLYIATNKPLDEFTLVEFSLDLCMWMNFPKRENLLVKCLLGKCSWVNRPLLHTQHSPLYPLLSLPFHISIQSIYHNVVYYLISSSASNVLPIYHTFYSMGAQITLLRGNDSVPIHYCDVTKPPYLFSGEL